MRGHEAEKVPNRRSVEKVEPRMIEEMIAGTVKSNNGTEASVSFADGAQKLFERTTESEMEPELETRISFPKPYCGPGDLRSKRRTTKSVPKERDANN